MADGSAGSEGSAGSAGAPADGTVLPAAVLRELAQGGDWLASWRTPAVLGALAVLLTMLAVRRRQRRARLVPALVVGAGLSLLLALTAGVNVVVGYVPSMDAARVTLAGWGVLRPPTTSHGTAHAHAGSLDEGAVAGRDIPVPAALKAPSSTTWVYTPPGYDASGTTRYPVVYLVHGSPGASGDWFAAGDVPHVLDVLIADGLVRPMIAVAVDVNGTGPSSADTECLDSTTGGTQVETYLTTVVVPWVDATYATADDDADRALGGFSSGGFCAWDQGLRHPDLFGTILTLDGYGDPGSGGTAMLATRQQWLAHDVSRYVGTLPVVQQHVFVGLSGADEHSDDVEESRALADTLAGRGWDVVVRDLPGQGHTWVMARAAIPYALMFFSDRLAG